MYDAKCMIPNPYIVGIPVNEPNKFFGRESLLSFIEDNLRQNIKFILLHGHRRIGKSSVLKQIPNRIAPSEFAFVHYDLQHHAQSDLCEILHDVSEEIVNQLDLNQDNIKLPTQKELKTDVNIFSSHFLPQIYKKIGGRKLVLLLDEFDVICDDTNNILEKGLGLFPYLEKLIKQQEKLFIISVAGRHPSDLKNLIKLFRSAPYQEIGFLDELSAKRLIRNPTQGVLEYAQDAITAIVELTAGHPYFIQVICFNILLVAKNNKNWIVTRTDVENVIEKAIEQAEGGLAWFWDGLTIAEKVVLSAIVESQNNAIHKVQRYPEEPLSLLKNYGVIQIEELVQAINQLAKKGFLDNTERRVKIEFVRLWLARRHPLRQEIRELEKFEEEEVHALCKAASQQNKKDKKQQALDIYNQALVLNPNHFPTLLPLAKLNLELKNFDKALQLYERANQVDPISNKEALLSALERYGSELTTQRQYTQAKIQYNRVLELQPDRISALQRLKEIKSFESPSPYQSISNSNYQVEIKNKLQTISAQEIPLKRIAALAGTIALVSLASGLVFYRWATPCRPGQYKVVNGIFCVAGITQQNNITNNISQGDRTLFPTIRNPYRDQGIKAFQQKNYQQAVNFFAQAVQYDRNDPEVLIYYNNALARQKDSPFTIAVVVPVGSKQDIAQEMLRGVAIAQNQFNYNGGFNGQLLEIAIADDRNDTQQAKQVAQQLLDDRSVLAVIGHYSSEATKVALYEYQKAAERLAIVSPTSSSSQLQGETFFKTTPSNIKEGEQLAEYIRNQLGLTKVVIFYNLDKAYSDNLREEFTKKFEKLGGQSSIIDLAGMKQQDADRKLNESVSINQVQAVLLFPEQQFTRTALGIAKAKAESNNPRVRSLKLLGSSTLYDHTTLKEGGNAIEGLVLTIPWFREAPQSKNFAQKAAQQWGGQISWRTATSYDATQALIQALSSNPSRATVLQRLRQVNLSPQQTSGDQLQFNSQGEIQMEPVLIKVEGSRFKPLLKN
ncbi:MAG: ABC transporter substrate-binding protein [Brasilonema octagenarum HA4186-MV1]|jgi:ABC-type branched-subunit amino acid transport system substrate-binding protein|nr:ABC transporter substrate-binding protein [Brasilonema octagenarum HA4186-MV1]